MDVAPIIAQLNKEKSIGHTYMYTALAGGTMSKVFLLYQEKSNACILKINAAKVTKEEAGFLSLYQPIALLPDLLVVDSLYQFMVYTYIPGSTANHQNIKKTSLLQTLVAELINHYQPVLNQHNWGWKDAPVSSWAQFLRDEVKAATAILTPQLDRLGVTIEEPLLKERCNSGLNQFPYLIHGDCGVHNFIVREEKLAGVIDPTPILGWPHYDVIYAFFSSPSDLTKQAWDSAIAGLTIERPADSVLYEELLIGLYQRLGICLKHHPEDWSMYIRAWEYWNKIVSNQQLKLEYSRRVAN
ncbi:aminoglycoside phosphotransferase family protein [Planococcus donghaensis]|uniref:Aminoglycoside phosphotransferase n=1 Tax=Planococcus donghaensis TaxID=414778 RepID=A0A1C7EJ85_9BACL|nr:aminoglycoside phosphotransferase family protein [Planococcus donghaensis]ANU23402.1 aminoglycoside phosphotransferase [Planococcus donghaensis]